MNSFAEILLIAIFMSAACALPGNFLVLRRLSLLTDAISHTVLLGIVLAFLAVGSLDSPFLIIGASLMGVLTVWLIELLYQSRLVASDSAIGLIFPLLFSIAVILVTRYAGNVHLDTDCILLGELAFAPFDRLIINGMDLGAKGLYTGGAVLVLSIAVISLFYKEIKLATFDPVLAGVLGFSPAVIHYGLMSLVSLVAVASFPAPSGAITSFQSIGSILVIAFMIIPAMTAALWTRTLSGRLVLSCLLGTAGAVLGIIGAIVSDSSLAGMMAAVLGVFFIVSLIFAPATGILAAFRQRKKQRFAFGRETLLQHLLFHAGTKEESRENALSTLSVHMKWPETFTRQICRSLLKDGYITERNGLLLPTEQGKAHNLFYRENVRA